MRLHYLPPARPHKPQPDCVTSPRPGMMLSVEDQKFLIFFFFTRPKSRTFVPKSTVCLWDVNLILRRRWDFTLGKQNMCPISNAYAVKPSLYIIYFLSTQTWQVFLNNNTHISQIWILNQQKTFCTAELLICCMLLKWSSIVQLVCYYDCFA